MDYREIFEAMDVDMSGDIKLEEFHSVLHKMGIAVPLPLLARLVLRFQPDELSPRALTSAVQQSTMVVNYHHFLRLVRPRVGDVYGDPGLSSLLAKIRDAMDLLSSRQRQEKIEEVDRRLARVAALAQ